MMRKYILLFAFPLMLMLASTAFGYLFVSAPVLDALKHGNVWIKEHPNRAEGYFFIGGVEGSAWAKGLSGKDAEISASTFGDAANPPSFVPWVSIMFQPSGKLAITPDALKALSASIIAYRKAVELDPQKPRYHLALAWSFEEAAKAKLNPVDIDPPSKLTDDERKQCQAAIGLLGNVDHAQREEATHGLLALMPRNAELLRTVKTEDPEILARIDSIQQEFWLTLAVEHYRKAYQQSIDHDSKADQFDAEADNTISVKAGERLLSLLPTLTNATSEEIKSIQRSVHSIEAKPQLAHDY
jgi:hypothetical protein